MKIHKEKQASAVRSSSAKKAADMPHMLKESKEATTTIGSGEKDANRVAWFHGSGRQGEDTAATEPHGVSGMLDKVAGEEGKVSSMQEAIAIAMSLEPSLQRAEEVAQLNGRGARRAASCKKR